MQIDYYPFNELAVTLKQELRRRADREFGDVPIVRDHVWAEPTWAVLGRVGEEVVSFLNIVDRHATADGVPVHLFGLNNVITEPQHRGKGYSKELNRKFLEFISEADSGATGLLFCADDLIPFYSSLGWKKFAGSVIVAQPSGDKNWPSNAMYYTQNGVQTWKQVNLCGLPW